MKIKLTIPLILSLFLASCGTAKGVLYGAGTVLEGVASDARTIADWMK